MSGMTTDFHNGVLWAVGVLHDKANALLTEKEAISDTASDDYQCLQGTALGHTYSAALILDQLMERNQWTPQDDLPVL